MAKNKQALSKKPATNQFAIASLVVGIISFIQLLGIERAIVAIVFGVLALKGIKQTKGSGKGIAIAGIVLGVIAIIAVIVALIYLGPGYFLKLSAAA